MAKKKAERKGFIVPAQSGADLWAWRLAVGLYIREVTELIGVSARAVERAEHSAQPTGKVLRGIERLQARLLEGKLDIGPLMRRRWSHGRTTKAQKTTQTRHSPRKTSGKNTTSG